MDCSLFITENQEIAFKKYKDGVTFQKDIEKVYEEIDCKMKLPDLLGKTVIVSCNQFPSVFNICNEISHKAEIAPPDIFVYEEYYYGAESYGINNPWIELSAKTIQDFTENELKFVIGREIYKIADGVAKQRTMMDERFKLIGMMAPDQFEKVSKLTFYHWYRLANYTADNFGYLMCGDLNAAVDSVLKMVLNSIKLAQEINIKDFIEQASKINALNDTVFNYTKADEPMPYAPHRIQNLLAYAVSERGLLAINKF